MDGALMVLLTLYIYIYVYMYIYICIDIISVHFARNSKVTNVARRLVVES